MQGHCRNGDRCKFSHTMTEEGPPQQQQQQHRQQHRQQHHQQQQYFEALLTLPLPFL